MARSLATRRQNHRRRSAWRLDRGRSGQTGARHPVADGDLFVLPLCLGIAIGRIGCFFAGLADDTYGVPTSLPWGVDFGDGIPRHPTQIYEILFLAAIAFILHRYNQRTHPQGATFRLFLATYLAWRLLIDFIKPQPLVYGLTMIQWSCIAGLIALSPDILHSFRFKGLSREEAI